MLTLAWWTAKWAALKALGISGLGAMIWGRARQIVGGELGAAVVIAVAAVVGMILIWVGVGSITHQAVSARDAIWRARGAEAVLKAQREQRAADERARRAAERERATHAQLEEAVARASELERALAALKDDPVIFPRDLVKELNR